MSGWRGVPGRVAGMITRRPLRVAVIALIVSALGATGLLRFGVDAGQSLLVGSSSAAGQTYASFASTFGADPIVLVLTARNPTAPYLERNLERLGALEVDLAHDPRVASVLGPGTVAGSLREAAVAEVSKVLAEYPYFIAETDYLEQVNKGNTNQQDLQQRLQSDISNATALLELYVVKAASAAHSARAGYVNKPGDRILDSAEKAVDAAVLAQPAPPLWAEYLAGPGQTPNPTAAQQFFAQVAAAYGDCDDQIASLLKITPTCQVFFERTLLALPACPQVSAHLFCSPKPQWAAVLPAPAPGADAHEIVTIRLKPQYVGDQGQVSALKDKINAELAHGIASDAYTRALPSASQATLRSFGPLGPTECGGASSQQDAACIAAFHDAPLATVIAGAPLLGLGVVRSMTQLLVILFPVALLAMMLILIGLFRVRGRVWPLVAAIGTTVLTIGLALLTGTPVTPAVLAGVPVLVGLAVDYAVQLVARFSEERAAGAGEEDAVHRVLRRTAGATLVAAVTTLAGLLGLALVGGIDAGPLAAVPLVAEFALVLAGGVVIAWFGSVLVALPLAVVSHRRAVAAGAVAAPSAASTRRAASRSAQRTLAIAENWRGVLALASALALAGWVLLRTVPVQTDVQQLLAPSLPELADIETVQAQTGYTNEVDIYLRGPVATGPLDPLTGTPQDIEWQCQKAATIRSTHSDSVGQATSIGDYVIATNSTSQSSAAAPCLPRSSSGSTAPSPSPSASPSPSGSASPSATPSAAPSSSPTAARPVQAIEAAEEIIATASAAPARLMDTAAPASATPSSAATGTPSASASPAASATASPAPAHGSTPQTQTRFLCDLRLFPQLSRTLVMNIGVNTGPCPPIDEYQQIFLRTDSTPIEPDQARIAIGVHTASVADQARLVHELASDVASPPNGMSAAPTGLAVLATTAYDNLVGRAYLLNLVPLALVALVLLAFYRNLRRGLLPLLPTVLAAGWAPLVLLLLGRAPGGWGATLGSFNPLTVVLGALIVALATEFGVVLLGRFYEERERGLDPADAAEAALGGVGRAIRVSALTLGAGFAVLAFSGLLPNALPLVADFGLVVVIDLALAVAAVFLVMLPVAVALERSRPLVMAPVAAAVTAPKPIAPTPARVARRPRPAAPTVPAPSPTAPAAAAGAASTPAAKRTRRPSAPRTPVAPDPVAAPAAPAVAAEALIASGLPARLTLAGFQVEGSSVPQATIDQLAGLEWIRSAENLCFTGPAGTGKTHLLAGAGLAALSAGYRVRYLSAVDLFELIEREAAGSSTAAAIESLLANDALLIDDLGFPPLDAASTQLLLRLVSAAYERRTLGVASHRPLDQWGEFLAPGAPVDSMIDRLTHHAIVVSTEGESYRAREARARRGTGPQR